MFMRFLFVGAVCLTGAAALAQVEGEGNTVEFRIAAGTQGSAWNTKEQMVRVAIGDTLRVFNDDSIAHQLHTNGAPCGHGDRINPGQSWDCRISRTFDPMTSGPLYDHGFGPSAEFWVTTVIP